jgi:hypothetical protein
MLATVLLGRDLLDTNPEGNYCLQQVAIDQLEFKAPVLLSLQCL